MSCQRAQELIDPYVDGELDLLQAAEAERHLDECEDCNLRYRNQLTLRSTFKDEALYYRAPADLQHRIRASLQKEMKSSKPQDVENARTKRR